MKYWPAPPTFEAVSKDRVRVASKPLEGLAVAVVGGGPSLGPDHITALRRARVIAVNNSFMLFPHPVVVVSLDRRWFGWHGNNLAAAGHLCVAGLVPPFHLSTPPGLYHLSKAEPEDDYTPDPAKLAGKNSGHAAINLAVHLGATRIYLAGFDMNFPDGTSHWHPGHAIPSDEQNYITRFRPRLENMVAALTRLGVSVSAITATSANIPRTPFDTAMGDILNDPHRMDNATA